MNLQSVGCRPSDPNDELKLAIEAHNQLRETLKKQRRCFDANDRKGLDTEIKNAWMISTDLGQRLEKVSLQFVPASDQDNT